MRVVECRLSAVLLAKKLNLNWQTVTRLIHIQQQSNKTLEELSSLVKEHLHHEPYSLKEIAKELELEVTYFFKK